MRLGGEMQAGYYPTPEMVARRIRSCLSPKGFSSFIDPCAGRGDALNLVTAGMSGVRHGVELEQERADAAREHLDIVLQGDSLSTRVRGKYGLVYLNPPYHQAEGRRLELAFLQHWQRYLMPGGVLVYVVPEPHLAEYEKTLTANFTDLRLYRFPGETYDAFKQLVIFGTKRSYVEHAGTLPTVGGELEPRCCTYVIPALEEPPDPYLSTQDPATLTKEANESRLWDRVWDAITPQSIDSFPVPMPLRQGHVAQMLAAGMLNNTVVTGEGRRYLVRGRIIRKTLRHEEDYGDEIKVTEREVLESSVQALDLTTGELLTLS